jgi:Flp pilus assembly pilin Flp
MKDLFARFIKEEEGQDLIEYALLGGSITALVVTLITSVGARVVTLITTLNTNIQGS